MQSEFEPLAAKRRSLLVRHCSSEGDFFSIQVRVQNFGDSFYLFESRWTRERHRRLVLFWQVAMRFPCLATAAMAIITERYSHSNAPDRPLFMRPWRAYILRNTNTHPEFAYTQSDMGKLLSARESASAKG